MNDYDKSLTITFTYFHKYFYIARERLHKDYKFMLKSKNFSLMLVRIWIQIFKIIKQLLKCKGHFTISTNYLSPKSKYSI